MRFTLKFIDDEIREWEGESYLKTLSSARLIKPVVVSEMWVWNFGGIIGKQKSEDLDMKPSQCHLSSTNLTSADRDRTLDSTVRDRQLITWFFVYFWRDNPQWVRTSSFTRFLDHTQRCATIGRTPLDEWSARRRDLYLTTHNTHNRQTSMPRCDSNPQSQKASGRRPTP
jgi:hypothetical protein